MPSATSSAMEPVGITAIWMTGRSPRRITEPLPNCLSICARARSSAFSRSGPAAIVCHPCASPASSRMLRRHADTLGAGSDRKQPTGRDLWTDRLCSPVDNTPSHTMSYERRRDRDTPQTAERPQRSAQARRAPGRGRRRTTARHTTHRLDSPAASACSIVRPPSCGQHLVVRRRSPRTRAERLLQPRPEVGQPHTINYLPQTERDRRAPAAARARPAAPAAERRERRSASDTPAKLDHEAAHRARRPRRPGPSPGRTGPAPPAAPRPATDSDSSVEPATIVPDQPSPSRTRPTTAARCRARPCRPPRTRRAAAPTPPRTTGRRPSRSVSQPTTGDSAYMPAMCRLSTMPTIRSTSRVRRRSPMCTGVIDITPTMTRWPDRDRRHPEPGRRATPTDRPRRGRAGRPPAGATARRRRRRRRRARARASSSGSGRSSSATSSARPTHANATRAEHERPGVLGAAPSRRTAAVGQRGEVGPGDRADGRGPHHQRQLRARGGPARPGRRRCTGPGGWRPCRRRTGTCPTNSSGTESPAPRRARPATAPTAPTR